MKHYTERLLLRPWVEEDAQSLYEYAKDPDIGPSAGWPPIQSVENGRHIIQTVLSMPESYAICEKEKGTAIGAIALKQKGYTDMTDREDECELGYWVGKPFWGRGYVPEAAEELLRYAFENLGMRAVWCGYYEENVKSKRVQEKLGFEYQYTHPAVPVPLLGETRVGITNRMTKEQWLLRHKKEA